MTSIVKSVALLASALLLCACATAQESLDEWVRFDYRTKLAPEKKLADLELSDFEFVRGIVFGRHGRVFRNQAIDAFLRGQKWYKPNPQFNNSMLNSMERKNLDLIRKKEAEKHENIEPGDLRFWRTKLFTKEDVGEYHSLTDLRIMRGEIEAIHGRSFPEEPQIQQYFTERYWYKPAAHYDPKALTEIERQNIATLHEIEKAQRKLGLQPGDMLVYQDKKISPAMIMRLSLHELRLLRNEIYALRGHRFKTAWLDRHFSFFEWYEPKREVRLTPAEQRNLAVILARETQIHDDLGKKELDEALLEGMWLEDVQKLRNEVYARHGKVFKQKWLQSYFESFPWYKRNPKFSEKLLTETERKNLATIKAYEETAQSQFDLAEG